MEERHHILELVAKTVGAARLVKGGTPPDATAQHLIEQPAIDQEIERGLGRAHLDRFEHGIPSCPNVSQQHAAPVRPRGTA